MKSLRIKSIIMKKGAVTLFSNIIVLLALAVSPVIGQITETRIIASDGDPEDLFARRAAISGDYAIVAARFDDDKGLDAGAAYIFKREAASWAELTKLTASDGADGDFFGRDVYIDGDYAIVGATHHDDNGSNSGAAYVFRRETETTWVEEAELLPSDAYAGQKFGRRLAIHGDYVIVSAYLDNQNGTEAGAAYIFKRNGSTWTEEAKLIASDPSDFDHFAYDVRISDEYAVVGTAHDDDLGVDSGSFYMFKRDGINWSEVAKLTASDGAENDWFGRRVGISGDFIIVGVNKDDNIQENAGAAYIFQQISGTWTEVAKLLASESSENLGFGISVAIDGDYVIVGAGNDDSNGSNAGAAYLFRNDGTTWIQEDKLTASDGDEGDNFGVSVDISGDDVVIGSFHDEINGTNSGSAYVYSGFINLPPSTDPVVADIPNQTIDEGESFLTISLDNYVADPDHADTEIVWTFSGTTDLTVDIDANRVATITTPDKFIKQVYQSINVQETIEKYLHFKPEVLILNYQLIGGNVMDILELTKNQRVKRLVIILTDFRRLKLSQQCLNNGADFVFDKLRELGEISKVIEDYHNLRLSSSKQVI